MKRNSKYDPRIGKLLFILPAIIIVVLVAYAYVQLNAPGTLVVQAEDPSLAQLQVPFTVNGASHTTPASVSLSQGSYTVTFGTIEWYYPPTAKSVAVTPGQITYSVGSYTPETKFVQVTGAGFNDTSISVFHGLTPVTWINPSSSSVTFSGGPFQQVRVNPGQPFSYTFDTIGSFQVNIGSTNETLTINVQ